MVINHFSWLQNLLNMMNSLNKHKIHFRERWHITSKIFMSTVVIMSIIFDEYLWQILLSLYYNRIWLAMFFTTLLIVICKAWINASVWSFIQHVWDQYAFSIELNIFYRILLNCMKYIIISNYFIKKNLWTRRMESKINFLLDINFLTLCLYGHHIKTDEK